MPKRKLKSKKTNRINTGRSTNDLIYSCYQENNDGVFPRILELFVPKKSKIADLTYGRGVFWRNVNTDDYAFYPSDLKTTGIPDFVKGGIDSRKTPYKSEEFDALVFDPPYMHTPGGTAHNGHQNFENYYANNVQQNKEVLEEIWKDSGGKPPKYHEAVLDLYYRTGIEASRILKKDGVFIVKCQDEVCANKQRLTHIEITNKYAEYGFTAKDLFVVMRNNKPGVSRLKGKQKHARKNHSYFMVYLKK